MRIAFGRRRKEGNMAEEKKRKIEKGWSGGQEGFSYKCAGTAGSTEYNTEKTLGKRKRSLSLSAFPIESNAPLAFVIFSLSPFWFFPSSFLCYLFLYTSFCFSVPFLSFSLPLRFLSLLPISHFLLLFYIFVHFSLQSLISFPPTSPSFISYFYFIFLFIFLSPIYFSFFHLRIFFFFAFSLSILPFAESPFLSSLFSPELTLAQERSELRHSPSRFSPSLPLSTLLSHHPLTSPSILAATLAS